MPPAPVKLFSSRDFRSYRALPGSPVAAIANRLYAFLSSDVPEAAHARYAYATAFQGHEPKAGTPFVGSDLDRAVQTLLKEPPVIVLAQGPMHPWGLFDPEREAERASNRSTHSGGIIVEPRHAIFIPWSVHQVLKDAIDGDEPEDRSVASFFAMACIIHETTHWIAARHGYKPDPTRSAAKAAASTKVDFTQAKIVQHSRRDWGTHAKELLLGYAYTFVSYADGTHEIVCQKILPKLKLKPALSPAAQAHVIGCALPEIVDVSKYGAPSLRTPPKWRPKSDYLIVTCSTPDHACHHGACRLRDQMAEAYVHAPSEA